MANVLYTKGKEKILSGDIHLLTDVIKVALVKNDYAQNIATDEFLSVCSASIVGTPQTLAGKSVTGGAFDAADITFPAVPAGSTCEGLVIYKDTGDAATSPLLEYIDTISGFPLVTSGADVDIRWDNGTYKIFGI